MSAQTNTTIDLQNTQSLTFEDLQAVKDKLDKWKRESDDTLEKELIIFLELAGKYNMKKIVEIKGLPKEIGCSDEESDEIKYFLSKFTKKLRETSLISKGKFIFSWFDMNEYSPRQYELSDEMTEFGKKVFINFPNRLKK